MDEKSRSNLVILGASIVSKEDRAEYDFYSTDPDCVNDLLNKVPEIINPNFKYLEPCAGIGTIADRFTQLTKFPMDKYDIIQRREDIIEQDYIKLNCPNQYDVIITNFPYKMATSKNPIGFSQLLQKSLRDVKPGGYVCSFQKLLQLESKARYDEIYSRFKPWKIFVYVKRVKCFKNDDKDKYKELNSTICYTWTIWHKDEQGFYSNKTTELDWIYR